MNCTTRTFSYYPGCSLHATGREYDLSTRAVFASLGIELHELEDWNCCGASSAHAVSQQLALALPARNLKLAQQAGKGDLVAPCAACYQRQRAAEQTLREDGEKRRLVEEAVDFTFDGSVRVRSPLEVLVNETGLEETVSRVRRPLADLRLAAYYGCLLVRPPEVTGFDHHEHPSSMDRLLGALGADVREWSHGTDCCGGGLSLTARPVARRLVGRLAERAREAGAAALVTACPLCQLNIEMRQGGEGRSEPMPVFYFTELMGLAFGLPEAAKWWDTHLISPVPSLRAAGLI